MRRGNVRRMIFRWGRGVLRCPEGNASLVVNALIRWQDVNRSNWRPFWSRVEPSRLMEHKRATTPACPWPAVVTLTAMGLMTSSSERTGLSETECREAA